MTRQNVEGVLIIIASTAVLVLGCYGIATCSVPPEPRPREQMERSLGSGAVCGELRDDKATCIQGERQFVCVHHDDRNACQEQP